MSKKQKLEEEIAKLKENADLEESVFELLNEINQSLIMTYIFEWKNKRTKIIKVNLQNLDPDAAREKIQYILAKIPADGEDKIIGLNSKEIITESPFKLQWHNDVKSNHVSIDYNSKGYEISIEVNPDFYSNDFKTIGRRKVYETELHWFEGISRKEISDIRLLSYSSDKFKKINWYGGDVTTYIESEFDKEQFEYVLLNGNFKKVTDAV